MDRHTGEGAKLRSFDEVREVVDLALRVRGGDPTGRRFPLLRLVGDRRPLSSTECEALVWELARLRTILAADAPRAADSVVRTIAALDATARLGAASRRGADFLEEGEPSRAAGARDAARPG